MKFVGLKPLEMDVPLIELETTVGEVVYLYNANSLRAAVLDADGLAFALVSTSDSRVFVVRFRAIRNLRVEQPVDWATEEFRKSDTFSFGRSVPGFRVVFNAGAASTTSSTAGRSCLGVVGP